MTAPRSTARGPPAFLDERTEMFRCSAGAVTFTNAGLVRRWARRDILLEDRELRGVAETSLPSSSCAAEEHGAVDDDRAFVRSSRLRGYFRSNSRSSTVPPIALTAPAGFNQGSGRILSPQVMQRGAPAVRVVQDPLRVEE